MSKLHNVYDKRINFVPAIILQTRARRYKTIAAVAFSLTLLTVLVWPVLYLNSYNDSAVAKIITLQTMYNDYKVKADEVRRLERETEEIVIKREQLDQVARNSRIWGPVLKAVADSVPGEMWFYNLALVPYSDTAATVAETHPAEDGTTSAAVSSATEAQPTSLSSGDVLPTGTTSVITIKGGTKAVDTVGKFMYKLNSLFNFGRVELKSITRAADGDTIDFELRVILEEEVGRGA